MRGGALLSMGTNWAASHWQQVQKLPQMHIWAQLLAGPSIFSLVFLGEIRTSARERWDEAEVVLEDYVEWHDRNHFLLRQKWNRAIFFFFFFVDSSCVPLTESSKFCGSFRR